MKRYIYIGIGGMLGSLTRYYISILIAYKTPSAFPINTFIINITGCFILSFFLTAVLEFIRMDSNFRLAISTGFIGSYTTFSTFANEINALLINQDFLIILLYFLSSFLIGVIAIWLGTIAARKYFRRFKTAECEE